MEAQHDYRDAQLELHAQNTYDIQRETHRSSEGANTRSAEWIRRGVAGATDGVEDLRELCGGDAKTVPIASQLSGAVRGGGRTNKNSVGLDPGNCILGWPSACLLGMSVRFEFSTPNLGGLGT